MGKDQPRRGRVSLFFRYVARLFFIKFLTLADFFRVKSHSLACAALAVLNIIEAERDEGPLSRQFVDATSPGPVQVKTPGIHHPMTANRKKFTFREQILNDSVS